MSSWERAKILNRFLGFNKLVQQQNVKLYETASAIGTIVADAESPRNASVAGMSIERVWLTATSLGLSMQPLAGLIYLKLGIDHRHTNIFDIA